jgi:hypothetical protein
VPLDFTPAEAAIADPADVLGSRHVVARLRERGLFTPQRATCGGQILQSSNAPGGSAA